MSSQTPEIVIGDPAPDFTLPDQDGTPTTLSQLWQSMPQVLIFIRHLG